MRRWAINGLSLLCLMLAVAAALAWVFGATAPTRFDYTAIDRSANPVWEATDLSARLGQNRIEFGLRRISHDRRQTFVPLASVAPPGLTWSQGPAHDGPERGLGLHEAQASNTGYGDEWRATLGIPFWAIIAVAMAPPAVRTARWVRRHRRAPNACPRCGYDRRASPHRCPECGDPTGLTTSATINPRSARTAPAGTNAR